MIIILLTLVILLCGNRFQVFNNREKQDRTQVNQLLNMIVKNTIQGQCFSNSMFEETKTAY